MIGPLLAIAPPTLHARATLHLEVRRARARQPFLAAVEIDTDPHWHVYWKNPGDSGIPTQITWHAPHGWRVEPLDYPLPSRFAPGGVAAYGYQGKTLFLARVTPGGVAGKLSADVKWLVCSEACIPGQATVSQTVALASQSVPRPEASRLQRALQDLPRPAAGWSVRIAPRKGAVVLTATPPTGWQGSAQFFPLDSGVVDNARAFMATSTGGRLVFSMKPSPFPERRDRLSGLIVFRSPDGGRRIGVFVQAAFPQEARS